MQLGEEQQNMNMRMTRTKMKEKEKGKRTRQKQRKVSQHHEGGPVGTAESPEQERSLSSTYKKNTEADTKVYDLNLKTMVWIAWRAFSLKRTRQWTSMCGSPGPFP